MPVHPFDPHGEDREERELPDIDEIIDGILRPADTEGR